MRGKSVTPDGRYCWLCLNYWCSWSGSGTCSVQRLRSCCKHTKVLSQHHRFAGKAQKLLHLETDMMVGLSACIEQDGNNRNQSALLWHWSILWPTFCSIHCFRQLGLPVGTRQSCWLLIETLASQDANCSALLGIITSILSGTSFWYWELLDCRLCVQFQRLSSHASGYKVCGLVMLETRAWNPHCHLSTLVFWTPRFCPHHHALWLGATVLGNKSGCQTFQDLHMQANGCQ